MSKSIIHHWVLAGVAVLGLSACESSSSNKKTGIVVDGGAVTQPEDMQPAPEETQPEPSEWAAIEQFLVSGAANDITIGDGIQPIVNGDWPRFTTNTTWNWQLRGEHNLAPAADVYVLDMFAALTQGSIDTLHNSGRQVICYFSAGTFEPWRPDADLFSGVEIGKPYIGFDNENWLNIKDPKVVQLMLNRMDMAAAIGCDGVELDNVDHFVNDTGFELTQQDALAYTRIMANEAHQRGLAVALKNNVELVPEAVDYFDLLINEECHQWNECEGYLPVIEAGKPVFNAEYTQEHINDPVKREELCSVSRTLGFQTLFLPLALDGSFRIPCQ